MKKPLLLLRAFSKNLRHWPGGLWFSEQLRKKYASRHEDIILSDFDTDLKLLVNLSDHIGSQIFWRGYYSYDQLLLADRIIHPQDVVLDVGANIGEFSVYAAKRCHKGQVHSFEPTQKLYNILKKNISLNHFKNAFVYKMGLGEKLQEIPIYSKQEVGIDGSFNNGLNSLYRSEGMEELETVELVPLDYWVAENQIKKIDLIKIDVEGAELMVLKGGEKSIQRFKPQMILEVNDVTSRRAGYSTQELVSFVENLGYDIYCLLKDGKTQLWNHSDALTRDIFCVPQRF